MDGKKGVGSGLCFICTFYVKFTSEIIMMKKEIKVAFHSNVSIGTSDSIMDRLSKRFKPIIASDYDYYFGMETIYRSKETMKELLNSNEDAIRIMVCGEAVYPDMNLFDYAIWFCDREYKDGDRIISMPLLYESIGGFFDDISELDNSKINLSPQEILASKSKFCNFIYSNPNAHKTRDDLFYEISKYKQVDSLGKHLKNVEIEDTRNDVNWGKISVNLKKPYKFSIAAESAKCSGYTTEKLISSMLANTIPIYWGNPQVADEFNDKSIIIASKFNSLSDLVDYIKEVDSNDELYCKIMSEPWRTDEQIEKCNNMIENYYHSFYHIFEQDKAEAGRRPRGCWPDIIYSNIFTQETQKENSIKGKIRTHIVNFDKFLKGC